jgi:hypothetical protein
VAAKGKTVGTLAADIDKVHAMRGLLAEVTDAYDSQVATDRARYLADLEYVRTLRESVKDFENTMLRDYWRTPRPLRAPITDVLRAASISRAWLYQLRDRVARSGELGPDSLDT